jgi:hypothetical protein
MTEDLRYGDEEESRLDVAKSTPWGQIGMPEATPLSPNIPLTRSRQDAIAALQVVGVKRKVEAELAPSGGVPKRLR